VIAIPCNKNLTALTAIITNRYLLMSECSCCLFFPNRLAIHKNPKAAVIKKIMTLNINQIVLLRKFKSMAAIVTHIEWQKYLNN
jgi:hypothetical protein